MIYKEVENGLWHVLNADGSLERPPIMANSEAQAREIYEWLVNGCPDAPVTWDDLRGKRDAMLNDTDRTQLDDAPLSAERKQAFGIYRQELRDLPEAQSDATNVSWPIRPV